MMIYNQNFLWIYRSKETEKKLNNSKKSTKRIWDSVWSQLKHEVFGMEYKLDPETRKRSVKEPIKSMFTQLFY